MQNAFWTTRSISSRSSRTWSPLPRLLQFQHLHSCHMTHPERPFPSLECLRGAWLRRAQDGRLRNHRRTRRQDSTVFAPGPREFIGISTVPGVSGTRLQNQPASDMDHEWCRRSRDTVDFQEKPLQGCLGPLKLLRWLARPIRELAEIICSKVGGCERRLTLNVLGQTMVMQPHETNHNNGMLASQMARQASWRAPRTFGYGSFITAAW